MMIRASEKSTLHGVGNSITRASLDKIKAREKKKRFLYMWISKLKRE